MKTLHRFILKSYFGPFLMTLLISIFILFMQFLWKWVDELVGKGLGGDVVSELFFFASLSTIPLALPMAVLLSSLMTFGNLAEHYELAALKSSGLSLHKIMRPLLMFTIAISIGAFFFSNYLLPMSNLKMLSTLFDIRNQKPQFLLKDGVFYSGIEGYSIRVNKVDKDGVRLHDVMIYDHTDGQGNTSVTLASEGKMETSKDSRFLNITLFNGRSYSEVTNQDRSWIRRPFMSTTFKQQVVRLDLSSFKMNKTNEDLFKDNQQMLNGTQLLRYIDTARMEIADDRISFAPGLKAQLYSKSDHYFIDNNRSHAPPATGSALDLFAKTERMKVIDLAANNARNAKSNIESRGNSIDSEEKSIIRYKIELWRKYTLSVACMIMFFIGAPLGAIIRKGGLGMPVVVAVILFILFWVLSITGEKLSKEGSVPPEFGMWLGCAVFLPVSIWLMRRATADASIFDALAFAQRFRGLFAFRSWRIFRRKIDGMDA